MIPTTSDLNSLWKCQKEASQGDFYPPFEERKKNLATLRKLVLDNQNRLIEAVCQDYGYRASAETKIAEISSSLMSIDYALKYLHKWMRPSERKVALPYQPGKAWVDYQPLGVIGIIAPWNYPVYLVISPLVGALAAGNRALIKMSEFAPETGKVLKLMLNSVFPVDLVEVVLGDAEVSAEFSRLPFDHLLFTGSERVGKAVMRAASDNLTPVTLELGGKSPTLIAPDADLKKAVEPIAFAKCFNAGQTCIAPDYVLLPEGQRDAFATAFSAMIKRLYPKGEATKDFTSIINERQKIRLEGYLEDARQKGAMVEPLFPPCSDRHISPTLLFDVTDDMILMQEEIFGPLLPVVLYKTLDEALAYINKHPRPLALYFFGAKRKEQRRVLQETCSGGVCLNDTLLHVAQESLPFGGVGASGMGQYHGYDSFLTFSKAKPVFSRTGFNSSRALYPPFNKFIHKIIFKYLLR